MARQGATQQRLTLLAEIARGLIEGPLEERLRVTIELAPKALDLKSASILLAREDFAGFEDRLAVSGVHFIGVSPRPEGITAAVLRSGQVRAVEDARQEPEVSPSVLEAGIGSFMAVPLRSTRGCLGVMYLNQSEPRRFSSADMRLAEAIGGMVGQAVENARLAESEAAARRALEAEREHLAALTAALNRTVTEADTLRAIALAVAGARSLEGILRATVEVLAGGGGALLLMRDERLVVEAAVGNVGRMVGQRVPKSNRGVWQVVERGESPIEAGGRTAVPLRWQGKTFGVLEMEARAGRRLDVPDVNLLRKAADEIAGWVHLASE